jgi:hypothetical protein
VESLTRLILPRWLAAALTCIFAAVDVGAQSAQEYDVKAVFLYNFATFVEWPPSAFSPQETFFVIGVIGDDPFGNTLENVINNERIGNRPMAVRRFNRIEDAGECHILFISRSETDRLDDIFGAIGGRPILTVADIPGFAEAGGMIGFANQGNRVRVIINGNVASRAQLSISSKLLRLARVIEPPPS